MDYNNDSSYYNMKYNELIQRALNLNSLYWADIFSESDLEKYKDALGKARARDGLVSNEYFKGIMIPKQNCIIKLIKDG